MKVPLARRKAEGMVVGERHDVVVIGASAGGIPALKALVAQLPSDFPEAPS